MKIKEYKQEREFANSMMTFSDYFEEWQESIVLYLMEQYANQRIVEELERLEYSDEVRYDIEMKIKELKQ